MTLQTRLRATKETNEKADFNIESVVVDLIIAISKRLCKNDISVFLCDIRSDVISIVEELGVEEFAYNIKPGTTPETIRHYKLRWTEFLDGYTFSFDGVGERYLEEEVKEGFEAMTGYFKKNHYKEF